MRLQVEGKSWQGSGHEDMVCSSAGTVFAAEVQPGASEASGYGSSAARPVTQWLRRHGVYARPLGNVVYLMVTPTTHPAQCTRLLATLLRALAGSEHGNGVTVPDGRPAAHAA